MGDAFIVTGNNIMVHVQTSNYAVRSGHVNLFQSSLLTARNVLCLSNNQSSLAASNVQHFKGTTVQLPLLLVRGLGDG
jgi:hypothetical protein